jgi:hypothetical protein
MILSLIFILLILAVAFWHYLQGFMGSTISAILAAVSVLVAFSFYEPVVAFMSPGSFADTAHAMMLVVLFAVTYLILRILFDKLVPGNVRVPAIVDKVGGGIMGFIVGCLAVGLLAVAAQLLPFGPSIGGYARYRVKDPSQVVVKETEGSQKDRTVYDEFAERTFDADTPHQGMILPVDDMVVGFVSVSSNGGSTAGGQPFAKIHPDYLQEIYGNRIGIEQGARRTAPPVAKAETVDVLGVYTVKSIPQQDAELPSIRRRSAEETLEKTLTPGAGKMILVVRVQFKLDASDDDKRVRVSTASVRLVEPAGDGKWRQYFPLGTVEAGHLLLVNKPDDFLFIPGDKAADFLFVVDNLPAAAGNSSQIAPNSGVFVEAKRYGRVDLGGRTIEPLQSSDRVEVLRKPFIAKQAPVDPEAGKKRLAGTWQQIVPNTDPITFTYTVANKVQRVNKIGGQNVTTQGDWKLVDSTNEGVTIDETFNGKTNRVKITFKGDQDATRSDPNPSEFKKQ